MKTNNSILLIFFSITCQFIYGQATPVNKVKFFEEQAPLSVTLAANWNKIINQKNNTGYVYPGMFICKLPDSTLVNDSINLEVRGHFRREHCYLPPIKINFKKYDQSVMYPLKSLKLVNSCKANSVSDQNLLKEYLIYKMYNLFTDKSFRVRLLNIEYKDSSGKSNKFTEHAFFIEDVDEMAKRNDCIEWEHANLNQETTERNQMTILAIFEYMVGNTDWAVSANHNIKLIQSKQDSTSRPYAVLYDMDWSGLVNSDYAVPDPILNTETVKERVYRGFPRTQEEINSAIDQFKKQKENIYALINNFELLTPKSKKGMIDYLDEFFDTINSPKQVKYVFIDNARTQ
ncbi:hypothetical protein [Flavihumibacter profundi]|jgi:hypothetical protein|uniref:hypothetical protein n=1 Tax=Flavihumibacter profundi TaxID=2716883 RepID=UPI001CC6EC35|nr:hypothetical protein [Flavihumibacter profundi]MBZ5859543.1 hypothetical protein [Flavihumibacter profundi]